uniref:Secreted protein n=1 Tax=Globisporangium ultimum (strain ATCC 200006 / CBS 805.95 / DAOM BR144) TaxID=431595 RepID=K3WFV5_GLOUD
MKAFTILALALVAAVGCAEETHIELRVHKSPSKLYITPLGKQCAYNASIDPSMYPCRDGGVCVRKNE